MKNLLILLFALAAALSNAQDKPNVLFIAVDDLKPILSCYGDDFIQTPAIDALAERSMVFTNAHCQQAVCGPSRASLLTGMRPDYTGVWDLKTRMRDVNPDILSMPQYFKNNGYKTVAIGKIYDPRCVDKHYDEPSWSVPYAESTSYQYPEKYGEPVLSYYASKDNKALYEKYSKEAEKQQKEKPSEYIRSRFKPSTESADVEDEAYMDGQITTNALKYMKQMAQEEQPFFLAVGFKRPHLPFAAPKKYWDLYNREAIPLAEYRKAVKGGVEIAYHKSGELYSYTDIPELTDFSDIFNKNLPDWKQKELIHGYMACVSFVDAQVDKLLNELKASGLDKNTIVVLWGDHGWHLGDHGLWCKHTNFEQATRVPLIMALPNGEGGVNTSPTEFIDIFPTLCEATGLTVPDQLQGCSLMPVLKGHQYAVKKFAVSQFGRGKTEGYSVRTDKYRLTLWLKNNYKTFMPFNEKRIEAAELYDYEKDPLETVNLYNSNEYKKVQEMLMNYFKTFVLEQNKALKNAGSKLKKGASKDQSTVEMVPGTDLTFTDDLSNWSVIARNGADVEIKSEKGILFANIKQLGKNPWDISLNLNKPVNARNGQNLQLSFKGKGEEIKVVLGPVQDQRVVRKVRLNKKVNTVKLPIPEDGEWPMKVQFTAAGIYEIGPIQLDVK